MVEKKEEGNQETKIVAAHSASHRKWMIVALAGIFITALLVAVLVLLPKKDGAQDLDKALSLGEKYLSELNYEQAIASYRAAIEIDPKCVDAYIGLADTYAAMEDYEEAVKVLKEAEKMLENRREAGEDVTADWERIQRKMEELEGLIKQKREEEEALLQQKREREADEQLALAEKYLFAADYENAIKQFAGVLEKISDRLLAYFGGVDAYLHLKEKEKAITLLEDGIKEIDHAQFPGIRDGINKSEIEGYIALAEAFEAEGMHERAVELLQRVYGETGDEILGRKLGIVEASEIKFREDYVIEWQDAEFERLVREYLGKETGEIHYDEVKEIEKIEIWGESIAKTGEQFVHAYSYDWFRLSDGREGERTGKIRTLKDLEHFTSLKDLAVNHQENLDISVLADIDTIDCLLRLESLSLVSDGLSDISVFSNLSALRRIDIGYNDVTDISPLAMLIELKNIYIYDNPKLISTEPLKGLRKLERVGLSDVDTVNLEVFVGLPELKSMQLVNNKNMDYNVLLKLELEDLEITCTNETFPVISQLKTLKKLRLHGWFIWNEERQESIALTDISRIGELDNLVSLDLLTEECHDISPLSKLQNIEKLELWLPEDCDLTPLKDLPNLKTVTVPSYRDDEMRNKLVDKLVEKLKALLPEVEVKASY